MKWRLSGTINVGEFSNVQNIFKQLALTIAHKTKDFLACYFCLYYSFMGLTSTYDGLSEIIKE